MNRNDAIQWDPEFDTGETGMDAAHHEFVELVRALIECPDAEVERRLAAFARHAEGHFADEDRAMKGGYASAQCHLDEHEAVLASVAEVSSLVAAGNLAIGRRLARELARWFPEHTLAMDRGLAAWQLKQRLGGARVVVTRKPRAVSP